MKHQQPICVTERDAVELARVVEDTLRRSVGLEHGAEALHETLDAARIVPSPEIPSDVVTMNSEVVVGDAAAGTPCAITLVFPDEADPAAGRVSVLSPLGNALLGARSGEDVAVATPAGVRQVRVVDIKFQPEAGGRHDR